MSDKKTILTPEQVVLSYSIAGIGYRFAAALIDTLLQGLMMVVVIVAFAFGMPAVAAVPATGFWSVVVGAIFVLLLFAIFWGYYIYFETTWNGQTPGKRKMGLRVIRDTGHPVDFRAVLVRNIVRLADFLPGLYSVGMMSIFASRDSKRLGDFAAGTIVIREERGEVPAAQPAREEAPAEAAAAGDSAPPTPGELEFLSGVRRLSREDYLAVLRFLSRAGELDDEVRAYMARRIAEPLMQKMMAPAPEDPAFSYEGLLRDVAAAYLLAAGEQ